MTWYYVDAGQQAGPVEEALLEELFRDGKIQADTLVWSEGMENWKPYGEVKPAVTAPQVVEAPPVVGAPVTTLDVNEAVCAECGKIFPVDNMIRYGETRVCANCKPIFMQKLREGAAINAGATRYAGFWIRLGAKFIDNLIMRFVGLPLQFVVGAITPSSSQEAALITVGLLISFLLVVWMGYYVFFLGKFGATPGKMACKIKVVMADGTPITYGRASLRFLAELLSGCPTLMIGYIMAGFDDQKRALHDRICNTRVIYK